MNRKTIVACYEELLLQGWVESIAKKGTFVHADLPELFQQEFVKSKVNYLMDVENQALNDYPERNRIIALGCKRYIDPNFKVHIKKYLDECVGEDMSYLLYQRYCELKYGDTDIWSETLTYDNENQS